MTTEQKARMTLKEQLQNLHACEESIGWVGNKTIEQAWQECHRGDWMLWLSRKSKNYDLQILTLAKGHCANTVRHLMTDDRCKKAVDVAIAFGEGNATREELNAAAYAAAADADAADAAAYAAYAAAYAAAAADAAAYAASDRSKVRKENQKATADICRRYLPIPQL